MAVNFNLLAREGPTNLYEGFVQGQRAATENALAQQKIAQERELSMLRGMELRGNIRAQEEKRAQDARVLRASQYREQLLRAPTSEAMRNIIRQQHADPILGPTLKQFGSLEQDLADVPDDPTRLEDYRRREAMGLSKWIESRGEMADISRIMRDGAAAAPAAAPTTPPTATPVAAPLPAPVTYAHGGTEYPTGTTFEPGKPNANMAVSAPVTLPVGTVRELPPGAAPGPERALSAPAANALPAAVGAAPPAAPAANALVAPAAATTPDAIAAAPAPNIDAMRRKRDALLAYGTPRAKSLAEGVSADIRSAESATPPEAKFMRMLGIPLTREGFVEFEALKQRPGEFERLLSQSGLPKADQTALIQQRLRKEATHAPGTTVNVSTGKRYGEAFGTRMAEVDVNKMTTAEKAPQLADSANRIIGLVQQGNLFTGPAADIKLNIARALNVAGASNQERIANTEALIAATGQSTLDAIKGAGLGTGQGFTDKDLLFLKGVAGGTINLMPDTLKELARLQHKTATEAAKLWNTRVRDIPSEVLQGTGISTAPIVVPPLASTAKKPAPAAAVPPAPAGMDAAIWNAMTPQERSLWQK